MTDATSSSTIVLSTVQQQVEAVWCERARRLSQRPNLSGAQDAIQVVVLGIGGERYGIDLHDVAEVFPPVAPTPVPGAASIVSGVINVHGEIRPVVDLRRFLGMKTAVKPAGTGHLERVILLRKDGRKMGLQIDSVEQIRWIKTNELQMASAVDTGGSRNIIPRTKGWTKDLLMLLSTEAIFAALDSTELHHNELENGVSD